MSQEGRLGPRSPSFPTISLKSALASARQLYAIVGRDPAPIAAVAGHLGYGPRSSGGRQATSALKQYGLMSTEGEGDRRLLQLTDAALKLIERENPALDDLREAALRPEVVAVIYSRWVDLPQEDILRHYLKAHLHFTARAVPQAMRILLQNDEFARISEWRRRVAQGSERLPPSHDRLLTHAGTTISVQFSRPPNAQVLRFLAGYFSAEWTAAVKLVAPARSSGTRPAGGSALSSSSANQTNDDDREGGISGANPWT